MDESWTYIYGVHVGGRQKAAVPWNALTNCYQVARAMSYPVEKGAYMPLCNKKYDLLVECWCPNKNSMVPAQKKALMKDTHLV